MSNKNILQKFKLIDHLIFDVDGVFTDGKLLITVDGDLLRTMNVKDGLAVKKATKAGIKVSIITGGNCPGVEKRFANLGISDYYSAIHKKGDKIDELVAKRKIVTLANCLYMGDDLPDIAAMEKVGLACCPVDAVPEVKQVADYISPLKGGEACIRDVIEKILKLKGAWM